MQKKLNSELKRYNNRLNRAGQPTDTNLHATVEPLITGIKRFTEGDMEVIETNGEYLAELMGFINGRPIINILRGLACELEYTYNIYNGNIVIRVSSYKRFISDLIRSSKPDGILETPTTWRERDRRKSAG